MKPTYPQNTLALLSRPGCPNWHKAAFLIVFALFFTRSAQAQGGQCDQIAFNFVHYEPCRYRVTYDNSTECYIQIRLALAQGSFLDWDVNVGAGFQVEVISASELWITHSGGFLPLGFQTPLQFTLPVDLVTDISVAYLNDCPPGVGCELFPSPTLESCPDPQDAAITGVKYRECGSLPYFNQATIPGWTITLSDDSGAVLAQQQTGVDGAYAFYNLPAGNYVVKETTPGGWTPKVPASGQAIVSLDPSEQAVQNFGNCPTCSCDSIYLDLSQAVGSGDTNTYYLSVSNRGAYCFSYIDVKVDSGQLLNWGLLLPGWTASLQGPNHLRLSPPDSYLPLGGSIPLNVLVSGPDNHKFTVSAFLGGGFGGASCNRAFTFPGAPAPLSGDCCPSGTTQGPELVMDGDFNALTPQFLWFGYTYAPSSTPGFHYVVTAPLVPGINGSWICASKSGSLTDRFLIVDGSTTAGAYAWEQTAPVAPATQYSFSAFINNLFLPTLPGTPDPTVELSIVDGSNNPVFIAISVLPENPNQWVQLCGIWTSPTALDPPYRLRIRTLSTQGIGNDFAVDCISFRSCQETCTAGFTFQDDGCGSFSFSGTGTGVAPLSYSWDFGDVPSGALNFSALQNPAHLFTSAGPHTVMLTITDATNCTATFSAVVTVPPVPSVSITANPGLTICTGETTVLTASGGPGNSYVWSNSAGSQSITVSIGGTYCVTCTDINGCTATACATVTENPVPTVSISGNQITCEGALIILVAIAPNGSTYSWYPTGDNTSNILTVANITQTYTVSVTLNGCSATATSTVVVYPAPIVDAGQDQTSCSGQPATLTAAASGGTPGYTYAWIPGVSANNPYTVTPTTTTTYTVQVTDANGCIGVDNVTVTVIQLPAANAGSDQTICAGQSATLTATGGGTYQWSPGGSGTNPYTVTPSGTTTYTVTVTANGCSSTDQIVVNVKPAPAADAGPDQIICAGQSATLTATGGGTYQWSPGGSGTNPYTVTPSGTSTYTVTVTANGCSTTDQVVVTVKPKPSVIIGSFQVICAGQPATLNASVGGGTPGYSYLWTPGASTGNPYVVTPPANTTYTVQVTDANGCTATNNILVIVNPVPVANAGPDQSICTGQTIMLSASGGGTYQWSPNGSIANPYTVTPAATTTYTVTVTSNGCSSTDQVVVTVNPYPTANAGPDQTICADQSATLTATGGGTYQWSPGGSTANPYTVTPAGNTTYTVSVTLNGCTSTDQVTVTVKPKPFLTTGADQAICIGKPATLMATAGNGTPPYSYLWTPGPSANNPYTVNPTATTTYTVVVTDANGCTEFDHTTVVVNAVPTANAGLDQILCPGQSVVLTGSGFGGAQPYSYTWNPGGISLNPYIAIPSATTTYTAIVTDGNGCTATDQVNVAVEQCCLVTNYIQNGDFSQGTPLGYDQIWSANHWSGIWHAGPLDNRNGDFWGPLPSPPAPFLLPCIGDVPGPPSQGQYAGFMSAFTVSKHLRQGILNELSGPIAPNSGCYNFTARVACPCIELFNAPDTRLAVYGVRSNAISTILPLTNGPASFLPNNENLFLVPPTTTGAKYLGVILLDNSLCNDDFKTFSFQFNSSILSGPIDRIFLTRDDAIGGNTYVAVDDICVAPAACSPPSSCQCGALQNAQISQPATGFSSPLYCNSPAPFVIAPCLKQGQDYIISGNFTCNPHYCGNNAVTYQLSGPGGPFPVLSVGYPYPYFQISLPWSNFPSTGGTYTLTISRQCGTNNCSCTVKFVVPPCPCQCDDSFTQSVNQGFSVTSPLNFISCVRYLKPAALCPNDVVTWFVAGVGTFGPSTGNNVQPISFPGPGSYNVCMSVTRTVAGMQCPIREHCRGVNVSCGINPNGTFYRSCTINGIKNGDFRDSAVAGYLGAGGWMPEWSLAINKGDGKVFVADSTGADDEGHLIFIGGKDNFAGIAQEVNLAPDSFITIAFAAKNYLGVENPAGTRIEVRLQESLFPGSTFQILHQFEIDTSGGWARQAISVPLGTPFSDTSAAYLVICLQSEDSIKRSVIGLDNLEICTSDDGGVSAGEIRPLSKIRIFPNPNPGLFTVELSQPATPGMRFRVLGLTGQLLLEKQFEPGSTRQRVHAEALPPGLYFLELIREGRAVAIEKFVKL